MQFRWAEVKCGTHQPVRRIILPTIPVLGGSVHLAIVKQALGHKNIASTAIYAVPTDEQTGRAVNTALAGLF